MKMILVGLGLMTLASCGNDATGPTPLPTTQEVKLEFVMEKEAWYDCRIAVQGDHSRSIFIEVNGMSVGALTSSEPIKTERLRLTVAPGSYDYRAVGMNYKKQTLTWEGRVLANSRTGATIYLGCEGA